MIKFSELIVGIVFFMAMTVLGYYTIIRGEIFDNKEFYYVTAIFEDVEGLTIGAKILVNGVETGTVSSIELMADSKVAVSMKLFRVFTLYENYKVTLKNQTALGGRVILINPGSQEIDGAEFYAINSLENLSGKTIGDPLTKLSEILDENREEIKDAIKNINEFSRKINKGDGTIAKLVNTDTIHQETEDLLKELRDTIEDAREQAPVTSFIRAALTAF
ncbi:MAG: MlaD family protein [Leptospirales bacterium]|nr:MlaD family protein [Leptospirales bacterium]